MTIDLLIHSAAQLVTCASDKPKRGAAMADVGLIEEGAIAIDNSLIVAVGNTSELQSQYDARQTIDASGKVVCPGFVDSHTHIAYVGDRTAEFEMRIRGATYQEIMAAGGGILNTMHQVRAASLDQLVAETRVRLDEMLALGTTTVEIKTGYGLDTENEIKLLRAIETLAESHSVDIVPTFLGAHAIPPEYAGLSNDYTQLVIDEMIPTAAEWYRTSYFAKRNIPIFIDVFCEKNAFTLDQSRRILQTGKDHYFQVKAHVDEFTR